MPRTLLHTCAGPGCGEGTRSPAGSLRCWAPSCLCPPGVREGSTQPRAPAGCSHGEALLVKGLFSSPCLPPALCLQKERPHRVCAFELRSGWEPMGFLSEQGGREQPAPSLAGVHTGLVLRAAWLGWGGSPRAAQLPSCSWASWAGFQLLGLSWAAGGQWGVESPQ